MKSKQNWIDKINKTNRRITNLSKHPFLVEAVDEEDGGLCKGHEEVTHCQVHYEVVRQVAKLLVTAHIHRREGMSDGQYKPYTNHIHITSGLSFGLYRIKR